MKKPAGKSARKSAAPGRPFEAGTDPRRGRGPKPGAANAGRPPNKIRELARTGLLKALPGIVKIGTGDETTTIVIGQGDKEREVEIPPAFRDRIHASRLLADVAGESRPTDGGVTVVELVVRYE